MNIEHKALEFLDDTLPSNASTVQRDEMYKAFFAGSAVTLAFFIEITEMAEDEAVVAIQSMHDQMASFIGRLDERGLVT